MPSSGSTPLLPATSRYELLHKIAAGGMATVYVGRLSAAAGTRRLFAVKRAHTHLADDATYRKLFVAEARLASRLHHPNVVAVQDVEDLDGELLLVMDYVEGASLAELVPLSDDATTRARLAVRIVLDAAHGLHAAHELKDDRGRSLDVVHRDVTPHNVLVGKDGIARVTDFGVAKSLSNTGPGTLTGGLKGKLAYMAPEYVERGVVDRRIDVFGLGIVLWEALTGERLFQGVNEGSTLAAVLRCSVKAPSAVAAGVPAELDEVVLRALARDPEERPASARAFAEQLEQAVRAYADGLASHDEVADAVEARAGDLLRTRRDLLRSLDVTKDEFVPPERTETRAGPANQPTKQDDKKQTLTLDGAAAVAVPKAAHAPSNSRWLALAALVAASSLAAGFRLFSREPGAPTPSSAPSQSTVLVPLGLRAQDGSATAAVVSDVPPKDPTAIAASSAKELKAPRRQPPRAIVRPIAPAAAVDAGTQAKDGDKAPPNPYRGDAGNG
ncbi:MAG: serine/threonine protein kinase [Myxococcales bacterium]|nr:serine/threonine protein kinase [Myxococcales bacterium]